MSTLFSPFAIGPLRLTNRIVIAPMCQYSAQDSEATDWHLIHLGQLAISGAGMLILEATAVEPEGRISPADLGLWSDVTELALQRVLTSVRKYSRMPLAIQLAHAGQKSVQPSSLGRRATHCGGARRVANGGSVSDSPRVA